MPVYVDAAIWEWQGRRWCHLMADDVDELHRFAFALGVKRISYQGPPRTATPHYDITAYERDRALRLGAVAASREEIVAVRRLLRGRTGAARRPEPERLPQKQEGLPFGSPSIVSPQEAGLTEPAPS